MDKQTSKAKILTAADMIKIRSDYCQVLPVKGLKDFKPSGAWLESKQITCALDERKAMLEEKKVDKISHLSRAEWKPELNRALVTTRVGGHYEVMGIEDDSGLLLHSEEILLLLEMNQIELWFGAVPMSIEQGYSVLLASGTGCTIDEYTVYKHLNHLGYRVLRHDPERNVDVTVTQYERDIRLNQFTGQRYKAIKDAASVSGVERKSSTDVVVDEKDVLRVDEMPVIFMEEDPPVEDDPVTTNEMKSNSVEQDACADKTDEVVPAEDRKDTKIESEIVFDELLVTKSLSQEVTLGENVVPAEIVSSLEGDSSKSRAIESIEKNGTTPPLKGLTEVLPSAMEMSTWTSVSLTNENLFGDDAILEEWNSLEKEKGADSIVEEEDSSSPRRSPLKDEDDEEEEEIIGITLDKECSMTESSMIQIVDDIDKEVDLSIVLDDDLEPTIMSPPSKIIPPGKVPVCITNVIEEIDLEDDGDSQSNSSAKFDTVPDKVEILTCVEPVDEDKFQTGDDILLENESNEIDARNSVLRPSTTPTLPTIPVQVNTHSVSNYKDEEVENPGVLELQECSVIDEVVQELVSNKDTSEVDESSLLESTGNTNSPRTNVLILPEKTQMNTSSVEDADSVRLKSLELVPMDVCDGICDDSVVCDVAVPDPVTKNLHKIPDEVSPISESTPASLTSPKLLLEDVNMSSSQTESTPEVQEMQHDLSDENIVEEVAKLPVNEENQIDAKAASMIKVYVMHDSRKSTVVRETDASVPEQDKLPDVLAIIPPSVSNLIEANSEIPSDGPKVPSLEEQTMCKNKKSNDEFIDYSKLETDFKLVIGKNKCPVLVDVDDFSFDKQLKDGGLVDKVVGGKRMPDDSDSVQTAKKVKLATLNIDSEELNEAEVSHTVEDVAEKEMEKSSSSSKEREGIVNSELLSSEPATKSIEADGNEILDVSLSVQDEELNSDEDCVVLDEVESLDDSDSEEMEVASVDSDIELIDLDSDSDSDSDIEVTDVPLDSSKRKRTSDDNNPPAKRQAVIQIVNLSDEETSDDEDEEESSEEDSEVEIEETLPRIKHWTETLEKDGKRMAILKSIPNAVDKFQMNINIPKNAIPPGCQPVVSKTVLLCSLGAVGAGGKPNSEYVPAHQLYEMIDNHRIKTERGMQYNSVLPPIQSLPPQFHNAHIAGLFSSQPPFGNYNPVHSQDMNGFGPPHPYGQQQSMFGNFPPNFNSPFPNSVNGFAPMQRSFSQRPEMYGNFAPNFNVLPNPIHTVPIFRPITRPRVQNRTLSGVNPATRPKPVPGPYRPHGWFQQNNWFNAPNTRQVELNRPRPAYIDSKDNIVLVKTENVMSTNIVRTHIRWDVQNVCKVERNCAESSTTSCLQVQGAISNLPNVVNCKIETNTDGHIVNNSTTSAVVARTTSVQPPFVCKTEAGLSNIMPLIVDRFRPLEVQDSKPDISILNAGLASTFLAQQSNNVGDQPLSRLAKKKLRRRLRKQQLAASKTSSGVGAPTVVIKQEQEQARDNVVQFDSLPTEIRLCAARAKEIQSKVTSLITVDSFTTPIITFEEIRRQAREERETEENIVMSTLRLDGPTDPNIVTQRTIEAEKEKNLQNVPSLSEQNQLQDSVTLEHELNIESRVVKPSDSGTEAIINLPTVSIKEIRTRASERSRLLLNTLKKKKSSALKYLKPLMRLKLAHAKVIVNDKLRYKETELENVASDEESESDEENDIEVDGEEDEVSEIVREEEFENEEEEDESVIDVEEEEHVDTCSNASEVREVHDVSDGSPETEDGSNCSIVIESSVDEQHLSPDDQTSSLDEQQVTSSVEGVSSSVEGVSSSVEGVSSSVEGVSSPGEGVSSPDEKVSSPVEKLSSPDDDVSMVGAESEDEGFVKPLLRPSDCTSLGTVLSRLDIIKRAEPSTTRRDNDRKISFDVYNPSGGKNCPKFRKSCPGCPDYRVVVLSFDDSVPDASEISVMQRSLPDDVPLLFAVVHLGSVSFMRVGTVELPVDLTEYGSTIPVASAS